jgi:hypothetical protein
MKNTRRTFLTLAVAALTVGSMAVWADDGQKGGQGSGQGQGQGQGQNQGPGNNNNNNQNTQVRLRTTLAGAAIQGIKPEGNGDFRNDGQGRTRLKVEVENVNLPAGTVLSVAVVHAGVSTMVGSITLGGVDNELELDSQNGATVPAVASGDMVTVSNGAAVILAGAF